VAPGEPGTDKVSGSVTVGSDVPYTPNTRTADTATITRSATTRSTHHKGTRTGVRSQSSLLDSAPRGEYSRLTVDLPWRRLCAWPVAESEAVVSKSR
jgi:hypothetical protein